MNEDSKYIKGFSKLTRNDKISLLSEKFHLNQEVVDTLLKYLRTDNQQLFDDFSENTLSNFILPFGIAPNFLIDDHWYAVPMVIEESSVVAAASKAAGFWSQHGGFKTIIKNTRKTGQIHFEWNGTLDKLQSYQNEIENILNQSVLDLSEQMRSRGGGIMNYQFHQTGTSGSNLWQLLIEFETVDSMGANFINSCLEKMGPELQKILNINEKLKSDSGDAKIIMCILSNYTPDCIVECSVECPIEKLEVLSGYYTPFEFANRFEKAIKIAALDPYRAATHNKGIMNGIDAVVIATGNDFRAIESNAHVFASRNGKYKSLTRIEINKNRFKYILEVPISVGTVGGLTKVHPMAKTAMEILENPSAKELMSIIAATGLANNFMAVTSLITHGIQKGHMKMHLTNILHQLNATSEEINMTKQFFQNKTVSYNEVKNFVLTLRNH